ncbi:monoacylglycerol lipase ABHD12 [Eurytemora carolleeae]|uniref:monoacylglycerol lipase ABHD12 n=1 Tax=Eurytemora carolleeae TaxID=1294199 RepID=UPI000C76DFB2|nr:monoacylglycerol lipase ABHD12 [Eurytemora carolleeae]|eukprot:XP_023326182.1 monoacylglycerol lipase ABHD12-like [Eurytemora affinis]
MVIMISHTFCISDKMGDKIGEIVKKIIFCPFVQYPPLPLVPDLSDPAKFNGSGSPAFDLTNTTHLFITSPKDSTGSSRIGAWYFLPEKSSGRVEPLLETDTLILYLHGNSYNRSQSHRVGLYKHLIRQGFYVLAIDYRGFGDSSPVNLSEKTVVEDARAALGWISDKLGDKAKIIVWGHSLGSAICAHTVAEFDLETGGSSTVSGVILESPFNTMAQEILSFGLARMLSYLTDIPQLLEKSDLLFESEKWLPAIKCPVLILHAEDDIIVPFELGLKLEAEAREAGKNNIRFISFPKEERRGHNNIYLSDNLASAVKSFTELDCTSKK